jgi:hypothetical protein
MGGAIELAATQRDAARIRIHVDALARYLAAVDPR